MKFSSLFIGLSVFVVALCVVAFVILYFKWFSKSANSRSAGQSDSHTPHGTQAQLESHADKQPLAESSAAGVQMVGVGTENKEPMDVSVVNGALPMTSIRLDERPTLRIGSLNVLEYLGLTAKMAVNRTNPVPKQTQTQERIFDVATTQKIDLLFTQEDLDLGILRYNDWYRVMISKYKKNHRGYKREQLAYGLYASKPLEDLGISRCTVEVHDTVDNKACASNRSYALYTFEMRNGSTFSVANYHACGGGFDDKALAQKFENKVGKLTNSVKDAEADALVQKRPDIILGDMNAPLKATEHHKKDLTENTRTYADEHVLYLVNKLSEKGYIAADNPYIDSRTSIHGSRVDYILLNKNGDVGVEDVVITDRFIDERLTDHEMIYANVTLSVS